MGTTTELDELRAGIAAAPRNEQGHRKYSEALKDAVQRYARRRLRTGTESQHAIAGELGISADTLWSWVRLGDRGGVRRREKAGVPGRAKEFRAAVAVLGERARTTPYPPELRALGLAHLKERQASGGVSRQEVASELGIGSDTLRNWTKPPRARRSSAVRRVRIAPRAASPRETTTRSLVVHGPAGLRIEGLDIAAVAALLVELS